MNTKNYNLKQSYIMNNVYSNSNPSFNKVIWDTIDKADDYMIKSINNKICDVYHAKINLINNLLFSTEPLNINSKEDIIKFFNILSPLNNEYSFGSYSWDFQDHDNKLLIHNSILKSDLNQYIYKKYINPLKNVLTISNINFKYYEFKNNRFNKTIDIILIINFN
jgi:hypothetical protein